MSGVPIIGKVFKTVKKSVKKVVKEVKENPVLQVAILAAVVYFTVGAGAGVFAAEGATGVATTTGVSQSAMLASQTAAFGEAGAALTTEALASNAAAVAAATAPAVVAPVAQGAGTAGSTTAGATAEELGSVIGSALPDAPALGTGVGATSGGVGSWITKNPTQAMLLGQAGMSAAQGYATGEQQKLRIEEEKRIRAEEAKIRSERGLMGVDSQGRYAGIVGNQMSQPNADSQPNASIAPTGAAAAPIIASQQVAPIEAPRIAVPRRQLPKLNQQGQLTVG